MKEIILQKLNEIEEKENVRIIHCVESGSRAWGFASPDSDYDVRFIYVRNKNDYLRLENISDVIEWQLDDTLDINGWDLQKALRLLYKSNPTLFEWNNSEIVYKTTAELEKVRGIINDYFVLKSGIYHYISAAKSNCHGFLETDEVKYKKYFYVLRPILACRWIIDKKSPPPILFSELIEAELDKSIIAEVNKLLEIKINSPEISMGRRIDSLNNYIEEQFIELERLAAEMENGKNSDWLNLDRVFYEIVNE